MNSYAPVSQVVYITYYTAYTLVKSEEAMFTFGAQAWCPCHISEGMVSLPLL